MFKFQALYFNDEEDKSQRHWVTCVQSDPAS